MQSDWDVNNHIENPFQAIKKRCERLLQMNAIRRTDIDQTRHFKLELPVIKKMLSSDISGFYLIEYLMFYFIFSTP